MLNDGCVVVLEDLLWFCNSEWWMYYGIERFVVVLHNLLWFVVALNNGCMVMLNADQLRTSVPRERF